MCEDMSHYHISDEDVNSVVRYMKIYHPDRANREYVRALLEYTLAGVQTSLRDLAQDPDKFETFVADFEASQKKDQ